MLFIQKTELRYFNEVGLEGVANLIRLPVDAGRALHVCLLLYRGAPLDTRIEFDNAEHLATFEDGPDWVLEVMAVLEPWTEELRDWADEKRDIAPGSHERSAVKPDFNPASPAARLTKLITMEDGGKGIYDLDTFEKTCSNFGTLGLVTPGLRKPLRGFDDKLRIKRLSL